MSPAISSASWFCRVPPPLRDTRSLLLSIFLIIGSACSSMIARSNSSEIDSDLAVRKRASIESELSSLGSCCIRMVCGRSRYLDGSEAKVKEVTLEHLTLYGLPSLLCSEMTSEETQDADRRRLSIKDFRRRAQYANGLSYGPFFRHAFQAFTSSHYLLTRPPS